MSGCLTSTTVYKRLGDKRSMGFGALLCVPWIASFIIPALKKEYYPDSEIVLFQKWFIYVVMLVGSFCNGFG